MKAKRETTSENPVIIPKFIIKKKKIQASSCGDQNPLSKRFNLCL